MAKQIYVLETETKEIDGEVYVFKKLPTMKGLKLYAKLFDENTDHAEMIQELITNGVEKDGPIDAKLFDKIFAGKLAHLHKVFNEALEWQFEDVFQESGSEKE